MTLRQSLKKCLFALMTVMLCIESSKINAIADESYSDSGKAGGESLSIYIKKKTATLDNSRPRKTVANIKRHAKNANHSKPLASSPIKNLVSHIRPKHNPLCDTPTFNPTTLTNTNAFTTTHNYETTCGHTPTKPKPHTPKPTPKATKTPAVVITREEFAKLNIKSGEITVGPPTDYFPTDFDIVYYTIPYTQTLNTTLLGQNVTIKATPTSYTWHLGDGYTLTTTRPGRPFPNKDITHRYYNEGWADAYLETTYTGQYQVNGGEWKPIDGTITVTSEKRSFYIMRLPPYLGSENHTPAPIQVPPRDGSNESKPDQYARHIPLDKEKPL
ncbi:hypothetical protein ACUH96_02900 [Dermabacteraceae bacterium P13077]